MGLLFYRLKQCNIVFINSEVSIEQMAKNYLRKYLNVSAKITTYPCRRTLCYNYVHELPCDGNEGSWHYKWCPLRFTANILLR